jgi:hypothetical protein
VGVPSCRRSVSDMIGLCNISIAVGECVCRGFYVYGGAVEQQESLGKKCVE